MPIKVYECKCGARKEILVPAEKDDKTCVCGLVMYRAYYLEGVQIDGDTVTGKVIK